MKAAASLLALLVASPGYAGWSADEITRGPDAGAAVLVYEAKGGVATLDEALLQLKHRGQLRTLKHLTLSALVKEPHFQNELLNALEKIVPLQLAKARKATDKVFELKLGTKAEAFRQAVLATPTVARMIQEIENAGMGAAQVDFEKPVLAGTKDQRQLILALWLLVNPT